MATVACIVLVSLWTPLLSRAYIARWFAWPQHSLHRAQVPLLVGIAALVLLVGLRRRWEYSHHSSRRYPVRSGLLGLGISIYPSSFHRS